MSFDQPTSMAANEGRRALRTAAATSLRQNGFVVDDAEPVAGQTAPDSPHVAVDAREECGCGLSDDQCEFVLTTHVRDSSRKPRELMALSDRVERALLAIGTHLDNWQVVRIHSERAQILRSAGGEWTGCLSFRALLAKSE